MLQNRQNLGIWSGPGHRPGHYHRPPRQHQNRQHPRPRHQSKCFPTIVKMGQAPFAYARIVHMTKQLVNFPLSVKIICEPESADAPYVAYAPELDISSCGPTEEGARKNLGEAVQILFEEAERKGKLSELLEDVGFRKQHRLWMAPRISFEQIAIAINTTVHAKDFTTSLS